jgi:hypothetical protein
LNESLDSAVRILVVLCSRGFDTLDFLLRRSDIGGNSVLRDDDGVGRVVAPGDRITQLLDMILHRLGGSIDGSSCGSGGVP